MLVTTSKTASAFVPRQLEVQYNHPPSPHLLRVSGQGWDNDNFLESLGGDEQARQSANDDYFRSSAFEKVSSDQDTSLPSSDAAGAELTPEMKEKIKRANEEDDPAEGGRMFREMMARAQQGEIRRPPPQLSQPIPPPPPIPQPVAPPTLPDFNSLSVEEQARLFREMMQQQQQPQAPPPAPAPEQLYYPPPVMAAKQPMGPAVAPDGRRIGRNRDADAIVNSSDVYFAQLKQDSRSRNMARYSGDDNRANAVWHDPEIQNIKLHINPYMEEQRKKEKQLLETSEDELLEPVLFAREPEIKQTKGPSYKDKLKQMQQKRKGGMEDTSTSNTPQAVVIAEPPAVPSPLVETKAPPQTPTQSTAPVPESMPSTSTASTSPASTGVNAPPTEVQSPDEYRQEIRKLMGLIIKHRGGTGFGAGRLEGAEAQMLEGLAGDVVQKLRKEAVPNDTTKKTPVVSTEGSAAPVASSMPAPAATNAPAPQSDKKGVRIEAMLSWIEGAIQVYKNSPVEVQESVLLTFRAALVAALETCDDILQNNETRDIKAYPGLDNMISVLEGAILMYRNSPPELQGGVLVTLRMALMSAVSTMNQSIADTDQQAASSTPKQEPASTTAAASTQTVFSGNDANTKFFEEVYEKLKRAEGDGKMGIREDISPEQARDLADSIADMRVLLVDELDNGIP